MGRIIGEVIEIELHPNKINMEDGFSLSKSWKPLIRDLREQKTGSKQEHDALRIPVPYSFPLIGSLP
jgi:hypothetical protein